MRADLARRHRQALPPCRDVHSGPFVLPRLPSHHRATRESPQRTSQVKSSQVSGTFVLGARPSVRQPRPPPWPYKCMCMMVTVET